MALQQIGIGFFSGLDGDTRPAGVGVGTTYYATDTKKTYTFNDAGTWDEQAPGLPPTLPPNAKVTYVTGGNAPGAVMVGGSTSGTAGSEGELHAAKDWVPDTAYAVNSMVLNGGTLYEANTAITAPNPTFDPTKWDVVIGGGSVPAGSNPVHIAGTPPTYSDAIPTIAPDGTVTFPANPQIGASIASISSGPAKGVVTKEYVLDVAIGGTVYKGSKDPTPTTGDTFPINATGAAAGDFYVMAGDGDITLNTGDPATTAVKVGDHVIWDGAKWELVQNPSPAITDQLQYVPKSTPNSPAKEGDTYYKQGTGLMVYDGSNFVNALSQSTGLEKITEGGNSGWRLVGSDPAKYGDIGTGAIDLSSSFGASTTHGATGQGSFAIGTNVEASGNGSTAMGERTVASGNYSYAEGRFTTASNTYSHAEGKSTEASGQGSHAENQNTIASGQSSHAQGSYTEASGDHSHAGGKGQTSINKVLASGNDTFNHQKANSGTAEAAADNSAILGGVDNSTVAGATKSVVLGGSGQTATQPDMVYLSGTKYKSYTTAQIAALTTTELGTVLWDNDKKQLMECIDATPGAEVWEFVGKEIDMQLQPPAPPDLSGTMTLAEMQGILDYSKQVSNDMLAAHVYRKIPKTEIKGQLLASKSDPWFEVRPASTSFTVEQAGVTQTITSPAATPFYIQMNGLNDASEITITIPNNATYFKVSTDDWSTINIVQLGDNITSLEQSFASKTKLTKLETTADFSKIINMEGAFYKCESLTSFPLIDTSNVTNFKDTWQSCIGLTSFPALNTSSATTFTQAFKALSSITSFPAIDMSNSTTASSTWSDCSKLVCIAGTLDFSLVTSPTSLTGTFSRCPALVAPATTGTPVRNGNNALTGTWTNPNPCP